MKGYSLHVGVGKVDKDHYGTDQTVNGPEKDARDMLQLVTDLKVYDEKYILTTDKKQNKGIQPTKQNFLDKLDDIIEFTKGNRDDTEGSYVLITFSGHGSSYKFKDKMERRSEFLCFYDEMLMEHEFKNKLLEFPRNVKCFVIIDACYSEGQSVAQVDRSQIQHAGLARLDYKSAADNMGKKSKNNVKTKIVNIRTRSAKALSENEISDVMTKNMAHYEGIIDTTPIVLSIKQFRSQICFLSACEKDSITIPSTIGIKGNSYFTDQLLTFWKENQNDDYNYNILHTYLWKKTGGKKGAATLKGAHTEYFMRHIPFKFNKKY